MDLKENQNGKLEVLFLLVLLGSVLLVLGMVFGDSLRVQILKSSTAMQGKEYSGYGPSRVTQARSKSRNLKNFNDARIRQDQYNRKHEPMRSRKKGGNQ